MPSFYLKCLTCLHTFQTDNPHRDTCPNCELTKRATGGRGLSYYRLVKCVGCGDEFYCADKNETECNYCYHHRMKSEPKKPAVCDCGAKKANSFHAGWCSLEREKQKKKEEEIL